MKEIKGLDERLAGLQQILQNVKTLTQSQADMSQGFQQNQVRATNIGDPSVLPDLCASHQKQLMMLTKNHAHLRFVHSLVRLMFTKKIRAFSNGRFSNSKIKRSQFEPQLGTIATLCYWARHFTLTVSLYTQVYLTIRL